MEVECVCHSLCGWLVARREKRKRDQSERPVSETSQRDQSESANIQTQNRDSSFTNIHTLLNIIQNLPMNDRGISKHVL